MCSIPCHGIHFHFCILIGNSIVNTPVVFRNEYLHVVHVECKLVSRPLLFSIETSTYTSIYYSIYLDYKS